MSIVTLATLVVACAALARSAPAHNVMDLAQVMNAAVCPIREEIDEDEHRVPRRIKVLRCSNTPNAICHKEKMTHACCRSHHHLFNTQCVNIRDHVLVRYTHTGSDQLVKYPVFVGCTCMIREETAAHEDR